MLDITLTNLMGTLRSYESTIDENKPKDETILIPIQRLTLNIDDMLISFQRFGYRRKKVLGWWRSQARPRGASVPLLKVIMVGFPLKMNLPNNTTSTSTSKLKKLDDSIIIPADVPTDEEEMEHRVMIQLLPLRCFIDPYIINFIIELGQRQLAIDQMKLCIPVDEADLLESNNLIQSSNITSNDTIKQNETKTLMYFRSVTIQQFDIKIDYHSDELNINLLKNGDYLQLLNLFPLEGLTLTLKKIYLRQIISITKIIDIIVRIWIEDIYQNQLHRILSGTTPFRGIASISSDIQDLLTIPMKNYQKTKNSHKLMSDIQKKSNNLLHTFTRETLHATHKLTMMLAKGIAELASDGPVNAPVKSKHKNNHSSKITNNNHKLMKYEPNEKIGSTSSNRSIRQPNGLNEGLSRAYESITREVTTAVDSVVNKPIREYERTGSSKGYVKDVVRALPNAVLRPIAGAAEGLSLTLLGLRNQIDPNAKIDEEDIWNVEKSNQNINRKI